MVCALPETVPAQQVLPSNREPDRTHDVIRSLSRTVLEALVAVNAETMGGRRSRYWCGPGSFRETKKAVTPDRNQAGGAPRIFYKKRMVKLITTPAKRRP